MSFKDGKYDVDMVMHFACESSGLSGEASTVYPPSYLKARPFLGKNPVATVEKPEMMRIVKKLLAKRWLRGVTKTKKYAAESGFLGGPRRVVTSTTYFATEKGREEWSKVYFARSRR